MVEISMTVETMSSFQLRARSAEAQARQARSQRQSFLSLHHLPYLLPLLQLCLLRTPPSPSLLCQVVVTVVTCQFCSSQPQETSGCVANPTKVIMTCILCSSAACYLTDTNTPWFPGVWSQLDEVVLQESPVPSTQPLLVWP